MNSQRTRHATHLSPSSTTPARSSSNLLQRKCACGQHTIAGGECAACRKKRASTLRRSAVSHRSTGGHVAPPVVHEVLRSPGQPLEATTRAFMEKGFGHDFSSVRVHTDATAAVAAQSVNALAFTVGRDIVFGAGQYKPGTREGRMLIAHELTHTLQQRGASHHATDHLEIAPLTDVAEREAEAAADAIAQGRSFAPAITHSIRVARQEGCVCGPNVTDQTKKVVGRIKTVFGGWTDQQKTDACHALTDPSTGKDAYDVRELRNQGWIVRYRPECATLCLDNPGKPPCGKFFDDGVKDVNKQVGSVQIETTCHYPGSVNYVTFGVMCNLCWAHLTAIALGPHPWWSPASGLVASLDAAAYTQEAMLALIWAYKGDRWIFGDEAKNYEASKKWANAGYAGWPAASASTPTGDRPDCTPTCPLVYGSRKPLTSSTIGTGDFTFHWFAKPGATSGKWH